MNDFMFFWAVIATIVIAAIYFRHRTLEGRNLVIQSMIEQGQPLPPDLFGSARSPLDGHRLTVIGIILIGLGFAIVIFASALIYSGEIDEIFPPFVSAFPFCVGIACLISARVIKRHD